MGVICGKGLDAADSLDGLACADDATHAQRKAHCPVKFMQESLDSQPPAQEVEAAEAKASSVDFVT